MLFSIIELLKELMTNFRIMPNIGIHDFVNQIGQGLMSIKCTVQVGNIHTEKTKTRNKQK